MKLVIPTLLLAVGGSALSAQTAISVVHTSGNDMPAAEAIGADLGNGLGVATNWNSVEVGTANAGLVTSPDSPAGGYVDGTGTSVSGFSYTVGNDGGNRTNGTSDPIGILHFNGPRMYDNYTDGADFLTLEGLDTAFGAGTPMEVYFYLGRPQNANGQTYQMNVQLAGNPASEQQLGPEPGGDFISNTADLLDGSGNATTSWIEGVHYLKFSGITASSSISFDMNVNGSSSTSRTVLAGFQVVAVPEPSTYALLLGALALGWVGWRRRVRR